MRRDFTYISLFSGAGIGCYGFKQEGFSCVATNEILEKRLKIQEYNEKCEYPSGYILGDITQESVKQRLFDEVKNYAKRKNIENFNVDVVIATPPCQGISLANHKKKNELKRNSLVVESIIITKELKPKFFIFENVMRFLTTICTDVDGVDKPIKEAIENNLAGQYQIHYQVVNFKNYGSPSSRTRTLVIGVNKELKEITPLDIMPEYRPEVTLRQVIGHLPSLKEMDEIDPGDIYHSFRRYKPEMREWIKDLKEGESAFDNTDPRKIPHQVKDGKIVLNQNKNGDKYKRQVWDKVAPCVHTRNDILASQNTIHPVDDRVFSIRELMLMMSIPDSFKWTDISFEELNGYSTEMKMKFLKENELNIRHAIGEAVPTQVFAEMGKNIKNVLENEVLNKRSVDAIINKYELSDEENLKRFIKENPCNYDYKNLFKIAELANSRRVDNSAYYTRQDICYSILKDLPSAEEYSNRKELRILEPSVGVGNFIPLLVKKYGSLKKVRIDVVDIDSSTLELLKVLLEKIDVPDNIEVGFINADFLLHDFAGQKYDIVIGNPPFKKITGDKELLKRYRQNAYNKDTNNLFAFFMEKAMDLGSIVALVVPKSLIYSPEYNKTRELIEKKTVIKINDYNEMAFDVKIETISIILKNSPKKVDNVVEIDSYLNREILYQKQSYIFSDRYPCWLLYRNSFFDAVAEGMHLGVFDEFRDRQITNKILKDSGRIRVLKSRNIGSNEIINIEGYDKYIDDIEDLAVKKYLNCENAVLFPNLSYYPRACFLPKNCIADGSVAILTPKFDNIRITPKELEYLASEEFTKFYRIARNYGTRSLNIDSNSVYFIGIKKCD